MTSLQIAESNSIHVTPSLKKADDFVETRHSILPPLSREKQPVPFSLFSFFTRSASLPENFHHGIRKTNLHPLFGKLIGNAVEMIIDDNVVIDVDPRRTPLGVFVG